MGWAEGQLGNRIGYYGALSPEFFYDIAWCGWRVLGEFMRIGSQAAILSPSLAVHFCVSFLGKARRDIFGSY